MFDFSHRFRGEAVKALLGLAWYRFRHMTGWAGKPYPRFREPTRAKHTQRSVFFLLMGALFLVQGFFMTHRMIDGYGDRALAMEADGMAVNEFTFRNISSRAEKWEAMSDEEMNADLFFLIGYGKSEREEMGLPELTQEGVIAQYREKGLGGFRNYQEFSRGGMTLREMPEAESGRFTRLVGMIFLGLLVALLFMPLAMRQKNLAATSDHQEWLFTLPMKETELLAGTFVSSVLIRPLAYLILWPLLTNLLIASGYSIPVAVMGAVLLSFLISIAISGVEILIDTWMRSKAPGVVLKNAQMVFSVMGLLAFYAVLAACLAGGPSFPWVNWLAERLPGDLGQPLGRILLSSFGAMTAWCVLGALVFGLGGCGLAGRLLRTGWLSGNNQHSTSRGPGGTALKGGSLLKFEGLLLLRDRTLATQVILVPVLIVGYQVLINPSMVQSITAAGICAMAYACGTYASLITAPQLLMSEAKGIWMVYNLPIPVAAYFRRRETLWRSVATGLAVILVVVMILTSGSFEVGELWRYVMTLLGVWVMGRVVSGIVLGKPKMPDVASGEMPKIGAGRMYGAMLMAGGFGALLWQGQFWPLVSALVIFWFLGVAIWQRRNVSFNYLMEPVEEEPPSWGVDDGLWAVVVFFLVQIVTFLIVGLSGETGGGGVLVSFVAGGLAAVFFVWIRCQRKGIPLPEIPDVGLAGSWKRVAAETVLATVVCLAVGLGWLKILETGFLGGIDSPAYEWDAVTLILLAVVAAPVLEELLFRGFMCRTMLAFWSKTNAVVASALIFAVVHPGTSFPPVFLLGLLTAVLYLRSRSVIPGMVLHALYNLGIVGLALS